MLIFQPLELLHDRRAFDCGVSALNEFLQKTARQHREKGLSNTYVLVDDENKSEIIGYFTLSFFEVSPQTLPDIHSKKLPKSDRLPAAKLARLAVSNNFKRKGYGALLLAEAIRRVVLASTQSGAITGFFVDAKDENARNFYLAFGFIPLNDFPMQLFLPLKTLLQFDGIANK